MTDKELNGLHDLLCGQNTAKLAFKIAEGFGYTDKELIELMWDNFAIKTDYFDTPQLDFGYCKLKQNIHIGSTHWSLMWNNIGHCGTKKSRIKALIKILNK